MRIIKETNFNFMKLATVTRFFSLIFLLIGFTSLILNKGPKLSIDFKGGTMIAVSFTESIEIDRLRASIKKINIDGQELDLSKSEIKYFGDKSNISVRLSSIENEPEKFIQKFIQKLIELFPEKIPDNKENFILAIEKVGPKIGAELSSDAIMAILSALALILIYISARFEFKFAIGAIAALAHDILITLGIFSILGYEISLAVIAAFLTIVGYSLNDTIVIFDRIRENLKTLNRESILQTVNKSINESLSRTMVTSLTTLFVVLILYFFGGEVIHYFSFALIIGVLVGTYSSIFVASLIVVYMQPKNK